MTSGPLTGGIARRAFQPSLRWTRTCCSKVCPAGLFRCSSNPAAAARLSSLAQVALKVAAPGVPDIYQGTELWDLSLVDPDNRRPVDYARRRELLAELARRASSGPEARLGLARELIASPALADGRAKLFLLRESLRFRRAHPALFLDGEYVPLAIDGEHANHAVAFARLHEGERFICVVPRLVLQLLDQSGRGQPIAWHGRVSLPASLREPLADVVSGRRHTPRDGALGLGELFADFPVALLAG